MSDLKSDSSSLSGSRININFPPLIDSNPAVNSPTIRLDFADTSSLDSKKKELSITTSLSHTNTLNELNPQHSYLRRVTFEPVSFPVSRVNSHESILLETTRLNTHTSSTTPSVRHGRQISSMHTPPITPIASRSQDATETPSKVHPLLLPQDVKQDLAFVTPQASSPSNSPIAPSVEASLAETSQADEMSPSSASGRSHPSTNSSFVGIVGESTTSSRESTSAKQPASSAYCRPFAPSGDVNDPYAADKRLPQSKNLENLDPRFKFTAVNSRSRMSSVQNLVDGLHRTPKFYTDQNRSTIRNSRGSRNHRSHSNEENHLPLFQRQGSIADLKRLFKFSGRGIKHSISSISPLEDAKLSNKTLPPFRSKKFHPFPFCDDHDLQSKYGKLGKVLGAGAGGSVRLMKRSSDGKTFAVKEFRPRHASESEKDYAKKVTAEFCIGSTLHHSNIIETLDIVCEKDKWYEVMEYAPYDLFAIVMTGKMTKDEISCSFLQILNAVTYLHSMGLAHRDLKLDNVVVNEHGVMKIIDFGSASVFKYPFESGITKASGIVGSDPYLAPEVYEERKYDPQPADIWSLAIIFCCMSLRRFPWKLPRTSDNSFKLFALASSSASERNHMADEQLASNQTVQLEPISDNKPSKSDESSNLSSACSKDRAINFPNCAGPEKKTEVIKGPWRLLRFLPRESRHIIGRMLEIDPKKRAPMLEIIEDPWVSGTVICTQEPNGRVVPAIGHTHTLEPPSLPTGKHQPGTPSKFRAKHK